MKKNVAGHNAKKLRKLEKSMNTITSEKEIHLYEADAALRKAPQFKELLNEVIIQHYKPCYFGLRLSTARKNAHISQSELGKGIHVSGANICKMEYGRSGNGVRKRIKVEQILYFCDKLNVTPEYLLGFVDDPQKRIISDTSEPSTLLEAWKKFQKAPLDDDVPPSAFQAIDPLCPDSPEVISKVQFIMRNLWPSSFMLLFDLVQLAEKPVVSHNFVAEIIQESFIGKRPLPSNLNSNNMLPSTDNPNSTYIRVVYQRFVRRRNIHVPKEKPPYPVQNDYVYNTFVNILVEAGNDCESLLDSFIKVASLTKREKKRAKQMLDCFVPAHFNHFDE